ILAMPRANLALSAVDIEAAKPAIEGADALLVNFEVGMEAVEAAMRISRRAGVPILLNPAPLAPHPPELLNLAMTIVANEVEAAALVPGAKGDHLEEAKALAALAGSAVVTLGSDGAAYHDGST